MTISYERSSVYPQPDRSGGAEAPGLTFFDWILPPPAVPLVILLLIILPMALLAAQSLFLPLLEFVSSLLFAGSEGGAASLPFHFFLKLGAFLVLAFFGLVQLVLRINAFYYSVWAKGFPRPHPLHVDYEPDNQQSMVALLNWKLYRLFGVMAPPLVLGAVTFLVGLGELYLFNLSTGLPFISLSIQFIVALFLFMVLSLFTGFAFLNSVWTFLTTVFGDIIAITEPDLPAKTVFDRAGRIAFASPMILIFYPAYLVFLLGVVVEVYLLLSTYTVQDLITLNVNIPLILGLEVLTLVCYLSLNYLRFYTYHHALARYYNNLPPYIKDRYAQNISSFNRF